MSSSLVPLCQQSLVALCKVHGEQAERLRQAIDACAGMELRSALVLRHNRAVLGNVFGAFAAATAGGEGAALATFGWLLYGYMVAIDPKVERVFLGGIAQILPQLHRELAVLSHDRLRAVFDTYARLLAC